MTGIYKIESKVHPSRYYVGSAKDIEVRFAIHKSLLKHNKHHSIILQRHYDKYGFNDLIFSIVEIMGCASKEDLEKREKDYFKIYEYNNTGKPFLNVSFETRSRRGIKSRPESIEKTRRANIGRIPWNKGKKTPPDVIKKFSESHKGKKQSEETKKKKAESLRGKKRTKEICEKISKALTGKYPMSKEHKEKLRNINLGNKYAVDNKSRTGMSASDEHREKLRKANTGKHMSEETKEKLRKANLGKKISQETRDKISKALTGRKVTDEFGEKMSVIRKRTIEKNKNKICKNKSCEV